MSLLMDALRKAEQQKQRLDTGDTQGSTGSAGPADELALEPILSPSPSPSIVTDRTTGTESHLPELPSHLEDLDEQFLSHAAEHSVMAKKAPLPSPSPDPAPALAKPESSAPQTRTISNHGSAPAAARNLFEAKQPQDGGRRTLVIAAGLAGLLMAIGIGGYVWWQMQPQGTLMAGGSALTPPPPPQAAGRGRDPTPNPRALPRG